MSKRCDRTRLVRRRARGVDAGPDARADVGSVSLELVVLAPGLLLLISLLVLAGRVTLAGGAVEQAAASAARQASISRTAPQASTTAQQAATTTLSQQGLTCSSVTVQVDGAGFAAPLGQPAQVGVTVTCVVPLSDLALPGVPGSRTVTSTAVSPLDPFRTRS